MNGYSWTAKDYEHKNGTLYEVVYLYTIQDGELFEKVLKRTKLS